MILIKTNIIRSELPFEYIIEGHAGYSEHGSDIVCAAVSVLHFSFLAWLEKAGIEYEATDDGNIVGVSIIDNRAKDCYNMVIAGFDAIADKYGEHVKMIYT